MGMTERLKQLGWLKPGNVEKTIESVEESKFRIRKHSENLNIDQKYFMNIFREKFPKVISNICLLSEQIYGIDKRTWSFESLEYSQNYHPGIMNWKSIFNFGIDFQPFAGWRKEYIEFTFNKKSKELEEIIIKGNEITKPFKPFKAKTEKEFCEKYFQLIEKRLIKKDTYEYEHIPAEDMIHLLNKIPEYIESMYKGIESVRRNELEKSQSEVKLLEDLEVTNFVS